MTKRERFMNFLENKPVDRVPVAFFHHFCPPCEWGRGLENQDAFERNIIGHKLAREKFDPDVIKIMNDTLMIMPVDVSFVNTSDDLRKVQGQWKRSRGIWFVGGGAHLSYKSSCSR